MSDATAGAMDAAVQALLPALVPGKEFYDTRSQLIRRLRAMFEQQGLWQAFGQTPGRLVPFGSSANACGGPNSDLDLCMVLAGQVDGGSDGDRAQA